MQWTDKPPQEPGWYWLRIPPHGIPQIVQVEHSEYFNCMVIWLAGSECEEPLHKQPSSAQWAGPIPEPTEDEAWKSSGHNFNPWMNQKWSSGATPQMFGMKEKGE